MSTEILEKQLTENKILLTTVLQNQVAIMKALVKDKHNQAALQEQIKYTQEQLEAVA